MDLGGFIAEIQQKEITIARLLKEEDQKILRERLNYMEEGGKEITPAYIHCLTHYEYIKNNWDCHLNLLKEYHRELLNLKAELTFRTGMLCASAYGLATLCVALYFTFVYPWQQPFEYSEEDRKLYSVVLLEEHNSRHPGIASQLCAFYMKKLQKQRVFMASLVPSAEDRKKFWQASNGFEWILSRLK